MKRLLSTALTLALAVCQARADSWMPPKVTGLVSPTGQFVLRLIPASNLRTALGVKGEPGDRPARAIYYQLDANGQYRQLQEITLRNPVAPLSAVVSDSGALVTLDNWHGVGTGSEVMVVYRPDGTVLRSYGLEDLYTAEEIERFGHSVSSIWWRCRAEPTLDHHAEVLDISDTLGGSVTVNLTTGTVTRRPRYSSAC